MIPIIVPIPIHQPRRDCVVVEGRRYCESQPITARDGATALLIGATLVAWMIAIAAPMVSLKWWGPYVSAAMFFGPVLVGAAVLYVVGG